MNTEPSTINTMEGMIMAKTEKSKYMDYYFFNHFFILLYLFYFFDKILFMWFHYQLFSFMTLNWFFI